MCGPEWELPELRDKLCELCGEVLCCGCNPGEVKEAGNRNGAPVGGVRPVVFGTVCEKGVGRR